MSSLALFAAADFFIFAAVLFFAAGAVVGLVVVVVVSVVLVLLFVAMVVVVLRAHLLQNAHRHGTVYVSEFVASSSSSCFSLIVASRGHIFLFTSIGLF